MVLNDSRVDELINRGRYLSREPCDKITAGSIDISPSVEGVFVVDHALAVKWQSDGKDAKAVEWVERGYKLVEWVEIERLLGC